MSPGEAARVLGVAPGADAETVRAAWRRRIGDHHPDRAGATGTAAAARINQAYAVLRNTTPSDSSDPPAPPPASNEPTARPPVARSTPGAVLVDRDTIALDAPTTRVMDLLVEVAHRIGDVSHLDRSEGLLELIATPEGGPPCSVVVTVQPQAAESSPADRAPGDHPRHDHPASDDLEVYLSVESLDARPAPPVETVASRILDEISQSV